MFIAQWLESFNKILIRNNSSQYISNIQQTSNVWYNSFILFVLNICPEYLSTVNQFHEKSYCHGKSTFIHTNNTIYVWTDNLNLVVVTKMFWLCFVSYTKPIFNSNRKRILIDGNMTICWKSLVYSQYLLSKSKHIIGASTKTPLACNHPMRPKDVFYTEKYIQYVTKVMGHALFHENINNFQNILLS